MAVGSIVVKIGADTRAFERDLKKAEQALQNTASKFSNIGSSISTYITAPLLAAGAGAFKMASDFEESLNKVRVSFGDSSASVEEFAKTTLSSFGIARGSALDMAATFGDMATSLGLPQNNAASLSTSLVGLAGDLASFKNISLSEVNTALTGIFTGETESLKRLGIVMTETNLQAFALTQGINKQFKEFTQAEKVQLRYNYILENTKNAQGDFARTGGGAANQMRIFTESIKEVAASFGSILLPVITPIINKINQAIQSFGKLSEETKRAIVIIAGIAATVGPVLFVIGKLISGFGAITTTLTALGVVSKATGLSMALAFGPVGIAILAIGAAIAATIYYYDDLKQAFDELYVSSETLRGVMGGLKLMFDIIKAPLIAVFDYFKNLGKVILNLIAVIDGQISLKQAFANITEAAYDAGRSLGDNLIKGFQDADTANKLARLSEITGIKAISGDRAGLYRKSNNKPAVSTGAGNPFVPSFSPGSGASKPKEVSYVVANAEAFKTDLANISLALAKVDNLVKTGLITSFEGVGQKTDIYKGQIQALINSGVDPLSDSIVSLQTEIRKLNGPEVLDIKPLEKFAQTAKTVAEGMKVSFSDLSTNVGSKMVEVGEAINSALVGATVEAAAALGNFLGNLISGDTGALSGFFNNILSIIADFGASLGKQLIALGIASEGFKKLFANPLTAIAAGVGLIAISKIIKNTVSKGVPSLAIGTDYVQSDGLAQLHKGEAVVPAKVVGGGFSGSGGRQELYGRLSGNDIFISNRQAERFRSITG